MDEHAAIVKEARAWVKAKLLNEGSGHDWYHVERVTALAERIAISEKADLPIVQLASLFHDVIDDKVVDNVQAAREELASWLTDHSVSPKESERIFTIIDTISFKGGNGPALSSLEAQVVQDADRLDALGAIGIARTFAYSGHKGQPIYDPTLSPREQMTVEEYRKGRSSAIHHFYEKLFKLKDLMNTPTAKKLAEDRHQFMERFIEQFYTEWDGHS